MIIKLVKFITIVTIILSLYVAGIMYGVYSAQDKRGEITQARIPQEVIYENAST